MKLVVDLMFNNQSFSNPFDIESENTDSVWVFPLYGQKTFGLRRQLVDKVEKMKRMELNGQPKVAFRFSTKSSSLAGWRTLQGVWTLKKRTYGGYFESKRWWTTVFSLYGFNFFENTGIFSVLLGTKYFQKYFCCAFWPDLAWLRFFQDAKSLPKRPCLPYLSILRNLQYSNNKFW